MNEFSEDEKLLIEKLKTLKMGDIDAYVKGELKVRVMREIAIRETLDKNRVFRPIPLFAYSFLILILISSASLALVSQNSLPNDKLYPVKVATEEVRLLLTFNPARKAALRVKFATERLQEVKLMAKEDATNNFRLEAALGRYEENVKKVGESVAVLKEKSNKKPAEVEEVAINLSNNIALLLEEAQKQLEQSQSTSSSLISERFVEAAQISVAVLSEVVEHLDNSQK